MIEDKTKSEQLEAVNTETQEQPKEVTLDQLQQEAEAVSSSKKTKLVRVTSAPRAPIDDEVGGLAAVDNPEFDF